MITMMMMMMAVKKEHRIVHFTFIFIQCCRCFITCHSRLEPRVVITRHLISPEVVTGVYVVIVLVRSTHKGALQHVRIRVRAVVIVPVTNCRRVVTGTGEMKRIDLSTCITLKILNKYIWLLIGILM